MSLAGNYPQTGFEEVDRTSNGKSASHLRSSGLASFIGTDPARAIHVGFTSAAWAFFPQLNGTEQGEITAVSG
jgi:hypothetical protein